MSTKTVNKTTKVQKEKIYAEFDKIYRSIPLSKRAEVILERLVRVLQKSGKITDAEAEHILSK